ncbi:MBL fold metallo-hydrolase [Chloroflexota bacterium]
MNQLIEEVSSGLYRVEIPLPRNPLKSLNSYLIKGAKRFLLIDTGMNRDECLSVMTSSLKRLGVHLERTDFFITHLHADHLGLTGTLATDASKVYFNGVEARIMNASREETEQWWQRLFEVFLMNGFPEEQLRQSVAEHPGRRYSSRTRNDFSIVKEGDRIEIGDYSFCCIDTPGHSPGHLCLHEESKKIFVSGDHILFDITPNITFWEDLDNSLKHYLINLEKVYELDVGLVLPGHRSPMNNHRQRIKELKEHHWNRLDEIICALQDGGKSAFQVAPYLTWDIEYTSWQQFPAQQKWFAFGETLAHLIFLETEGRVRGEKQDGKLLFSLV